MYPSNIKEGEVLAGYDAVIAGLTRDGPSAKELERIVAKMRSDWYRDLEIPVFRASDLSHAVLYDGNFESVYALPKELGGVTADEVRAFAAKYLVKTNRTIINRVPAPPENAKPKQAGEN